MSLLPDIEDGRLLPVKEPERYRPPKLSKYERDHWNKDIEQQRELNNHNRSVVAEDYSDSPTLK